MSDRTVAESTAPIDIITPQTLEATGTIELATALARALPSLNFPRPAIEAIYANSESGQLPYTSYAPFGFNGAFAYAKVGYKWRGGVGGVMPRPGSERNE